jgi:hypothetical protein
VIFHSYVSLSKGKSPPHAKTAEVLNYLDYTLYV